MDNTNHSNRLHWIWVADHTDTSGNLFGGCLTAPCCIAMAGGTCLRCFAGALLPLVGPPLYASLGLRWENSTLGFISLIFMPVPLSLMKYGERLRKNSRLNQDTEGEREVVSAPDQVYPKEN
ncbi:cycloheximide resistance protein [Rutstroemia sp. NJR-2017a WRK4]|nr:cycloheximide resistance protein [Rutstroemia sp. NJR-2017a WRK4]